MLFERKIKYLDYLENGVRIKGAGFIKLETRNGTCELQIQVSGMHMTDNYTREVYMVSGKNAALLGELSLCGGKGSMYLSGLDNLNLAGTGISYEQLSGIRIPIAAGREIYGSIRKIEGVTEEQEVVEIEQVELPVSENMMEENLSTEELNMQEDTPEQQEMSVQQEMQEQTRGLADTKWNQLSAIYPHIAPFRDERDYLSIGPGDFVILPDKYYRMANNSFLLHGYYNYKHLILSRMTDKGQPVYYIGVPGNYYEREKQVAVLFGFESFECLEEPARAGDYGYYMLRVEL